MFLVALCTGVHSYSLHSTSENSDSRESPREGAQTITELFGLGVLGGAGGAGGRGRERGRYFM